MKQNVRQSIARLTERNIPFDINSRLKRHSNMKIYITLVVLLAIHLCSVSKLPLLNLDFTLLRIEVFIVLVLMSVTNQWSLSCQQARFLIRDGPGNARCPAIGQHDLTDDNRFNINRDFKADIENETGQQYICLKPIYFAKQMVSGFLYYVKVSSRKRHSISLIISHSLFNMIAFFTFRFARQIEKMLKKLLK